MTATPPNLGKAAHAIAHCHGHLHGAEGGVGAGHRVVEEDHHAIAGKLFERATTFEDQRPKCLVVFAQDGHHVFGLGGFGEGREAADIAEDDRDLAPVAAEEVLLRRQNHVRNLRGNEAPQCAEALDFRHLLRNAPFELEVPGAKFFRLPGDGREERLLHVAQSLLLDAGADTGL